LLVGIEERIEPDFLKAKKSLERPMS
jgi:hypothetical protein